MTMLARAAAGLAWVAALVASAIVLARLGEPTLSPPPLAPSGWVAWAAGRSAVEAAFALGRVGVLALACYLLAATGLGLLARLLRAGPLLRAAHVATLPALRPLLDAVLGVSLAAAVLTGPALADGGGHRDPAAPGLPAESPGHLPDQPAAAVAEAAPAAAEAAPAVATWTVAAGEHFWSIAEAVLGGSGGRPRTAEVARYWIALIEANRALLPDPSNPDLLYPGITLQLPHRTG